MRIALQADVGTERPVQRLPILFRWAMMMGWFREIWRRWYQAGRFWSNFEDRAEKLDDGLSVAWEKIKKTLSFVLRIIVLSSAMELYLRFRSEREQDSNLHTVSGFLKWYELRFLQRCAPVCSVTLVRSDSLRPWGLSPPGSSAHGDSPGKNTGVGCHALLWGDFPGPGTEPAFLMPAKLAGWFFPTSATWEAHTSLIIILIRYTIFKV